MDEASAFAEFITEWSNDPGYEADEQTTRQNNKQYIYKHVELLVRNAYNERPWIRRTLIFTGQSSYTSNIIQSFRDTTKNMDYMAPSGIIYFGPG